MPEARSWAVLEPMMRGGPYRIVKDLCRGKFLPARQRFCTLVFSYLKVCEALDPQMPSVIKQLSSMRASKFFVSPLTKLSKTGHGLPLMHLMV